MEDKSKIFLKEQADKTVQLKIDEANTSAKAVADRVADIFWGKDANNIN